MSQSVFQPVGQKRLTNVAMVRLKKKGKRFEIACYKNKVVNWRERVEKDLDEVLQTTTVFANVSKGVLAKREDLLDVFGTDDEEKICIRLLAEGELQVSDKERELEYGTLFRDVASVISEKCVNPENNRPYTLTMIERGLKDLGFAVDPKKNAKQQALEALPQLQSKIPIRRARMRLKIAVNLANENDLHMLLRAEKADIEQTNFSNTQMTIICLAEPGCFRNMHSMVQSMSSGSGRVEVIALAATDEGNTGAQYTASTVSENQKGAHSHPSSIGGPTAAEASRPSAAANANGFQPIQASAAPQSTPAADKAEKASLPVVYERGPVASIPEEHVGASRKARFSELDQLQPGWTIEVKGRPGGGVADPTFYSPSGQQVSSFAIARRTALQRVYGRTRMICAGDGPKHGDGQCR
ncbi:hypothetical protein WJX84_009675 [Apatococcus fuscideae]|uniref:Uncharacterized protein n=1 Tax=Apatococcus fuscideae TaxID=2026836 RepID=A0AAW1SNZ2_9CHLO